MMHPVKSLYVGDLDSKTHEQDLLAHFGQIGGLAGVRVCRDRISGQSLCYAYVNYNTAAQAEKALKMLNHKLVNGKLMRIMLVKRDPYDRKTGIGNLYVKNLELMVTAEDLERVFSGYGSVLSCKVAYDECTQVSKCFGFVQMGSAQEAEKAVSSLHGSSSTGLSTSLYVAKFVKKGSQKKNLYIKNLDRSITGEALREKFSQFGQVVSAVVMQDKCGNSRGFGFVSFKQSQEAESALYAMHGSAWGSKTLYVALAQKKAERMALLKRQFAGMEKVVTAAGMGYGLYVANLEESVSAEDLKQLFESCGHVIFAKVVRHPNQRSRGFGFVYLATPQAAQSAISMDGTGILKSKPIAVKPAKPKQKRRNYAGMTTRATAAPAGTAYSHTAGVAPAQPYPYQLYQNVAPMNIYNASPSMGQAPWANYSHSVPFHGYSHQPAPIPYSYFDSSLMQCQYVQVV